MKKIKNEKSFGLWQFVIVAGILAMLAIVVVIKSEKNPGAIERTAEEVMLRFDYNLDHKSQTNIHPFLRSVYFSIGTKAAACGTMVLNTEGKPVQIVTANHLFSDTQPGSDYYDYHVLGPNGFTSQGHLNRVVLDSMRTSPLVEGIQDIAFCYMGEPALISRTSKVIVSAVSPSKHDFIIAQIASFNVTSVTTGERFEIVGEMINSVTNAFYVMLYESMNGESGSGFWKDEGSPLTGNKGKLYVMSGIIGVSAQTRRDLKIPVKFKSLTVMSAIEIKW